MRASENLSAIGAHMGEISRSPVTWLLIGVNVILFFIEDRAGGSAHTEVAVRFGAQITPRLQAHEYWRLFTAMFLHFGVMHLICNMWSLYNLGPIVERMFGAWRFLLIYFAAGLCGNLLTWAVETRTGKYAVSAGASGAIFGLLGVIFVLALMPRFRGYFSLRSILLTLVINVAYGIQARGINMVAHFGGFLGGAAVACAMIFL